MFGHEQRLSTRVKVKPSFHTILRNAQDRFHKMASYLVNQIQLPLMRCGTIWTIFTFTVSGKWLDRTEVCVWQLQCRSPPKNSGDEDDNLRFYGKKDSSKLKMNKVVTHTKNVNFKRTSILASFANKFLPARKVFKSHSFVQVEICFLLALPAELAKEARNEVLLHWMEPDHHVHFSASVFRLVTLVCSYFTPSCHTVQQLSLSCSV